MRVLLTLGGAAAGFFFGGPIGAIAGGAAGYVVGGAASKPKKLEGQTSIDGWNIAPALKAPGDYQWFDKLAKKVLNGTKSNVVFSIVKVLTIGEPALVAPLTGSIVDVYMEGDKRVWIVQQVSQPKIDVATPPKYTVWKLYDGDIASANSAGDELKGATA